MAQKTVSQEIDKLFHVLGVWGPFQIIQLVVVFSLTWPASHELFAILYTGYQPPVRCKIFNSSDVIVNLDISNISDYTKFYKKCADVVDIVNGTRVTGSCSRGYEYNQPREATFVSEWDLVCERSYQAQLPQTLLIGGQLVGASLFTTMADRFGRRKACLISQVGILASSLASAFSPNIVVLAILRFLTGAFQQGLVMSYAVIPIEMLPTENRASMFLILGILWPISLQFLNGLGYIFRFRSWRHFQLVLSGVIMITLIPNFFLLKETLRWLFANRRVEDINKVIKKAIDTNKAPQKEAWSQTLKCLSLTPQTRPTDGTNMELSALGLTGREGRKVANDQSQNENTGVVILTILRSPRLRFTAAAMFFVWIINALTHFGLVLTSSKLAGNRFLNYTLVSLDMLPASIIAYFILTRAGRKVASCVLHALAGLSLIAAVLVQLFGGLEFSTLVTALTILGKFGNSASFLLLFQYTPELYPTNLRSFGLGFASSSSRLGGMVAPFSNLVMDYVPWAPGTVYGVCSLLACLLIMCLPETLNKQLPQTVIEINNWKKEKEVDGQRQN